MSKDVLTIKTSVVAIGDDSKPEWYIDEIDKETLKFSMWSNMGFMPSDPRFSETVSSILEGGRSVVIAVAIGELDNYLILNHLGYRYMIQGNSSLESYDSYLRRNLAKNVSELVGASDV